MGYPREVVRIHRELGAGLTADTHSDPGLDTELGACECGCLELQSELDPDPRGQRGFCFALEDVMPADRSLGARNSSAWRAR